MLTLLYAMNNIHNMNPNTNQKSNQTKMNNCYKYW